MFNRKRRRHITVLKRLEYIPTHEMSHGASLQASRHSYTRSDGSGTIRQLPFLRTWRAYEAISQTSPRLRTMKTASLGSANARRMTKSRGETAHRRVRVVSESSPSDATNMSPCLPSIPHIQPMYTEILYYSFFCARGCCARYSMYIRVLRLRRR